MIEFYETSYDMQAKKNAEMEAVLFGWEDCAPSHGYGPTVRPYHLFHFITRGTGFLRIGEKEYLLQAGDAFLIPADDVSYYEASEAAPWSYAWVGLTGLRAAQYVRQIQDISPERFIIRGLDTGKYAEVIKRIAVLNGTSAVNYFQTQGALYELFGLLAADLSGLRDPRYVPSLAVRIKSYLEAKYAEKLQLSEVAEHFGVHPNHLSRVFRETYQIPPKQFLMNLKLEKAAQMLAETDESVLSISSYLGFDDQHAFSKSFKKHIGVSPLVYRKRSSDGQTQDEQGFANQIHDE